MPILGKTGYADFGQNRAVAPREMSARSNMILQRAVGARSASPGESGGGKGKKKGGKRGDSPKRDRSPSTGKKPPCKFHLKRKCTRGAECKDWHSPPCRFFKNGSCTSGDRRILLHLRTGAATPATSPSSGGPEPTTDGDGCEQSRGRSGSPRRGGRMGAAAFC